MYNITNCNRVNFYLKFGRYIRDIQTQIQAVCDYLLDIIQQNNPVVVGGRVQNKNNRNMRHNINISNNAKKSNKFDPKNISKIFKQFDELLKKKGI